MSMKFNFQYWVRKYAEDYHKDTGGKYPLYVDARGVKKQEKSPYFETMSKVLQKRGFLLKPEFLSICVWKTPRQIRNYEANSENTVKEITERVIEAKCEEDQVSLLDL